MTVLEHLDELRSRLLRIAIVYAVSFAVCWAASGPIVDFLLNPIRAHFFGGGDIVFIRLTEPFLVYMKAAALCAVFVVAPYVLHQLWAFVAPGLHARERGLALPFLLFGSAFFAAGGAFGYFVATPRAAAWLVDLGREFRPMITLESAFSFQSRIILAMGVVFELPILIFFLSRIGVVTPGFLMRNFRYAVLIISIVAAVVTPTGDMVTMSVFVLPMVLLYLLGVLVSWVFASRTTADPTR